MKTFFSGSIPYLAYTTALQDARYHLADAYGPHDFFNATNKFIYPNEPGYAAVYNKLAEAILDHPIDHCGIQAIKVDEEPQWQFIQFVCDMDGGNMGVYEQKFFVTVIHDDAEAVHFKLKYK
jgi:hypothetical protein